MRWWQFALLGAGGGAIVEVLSLFRWFTAWQMARRSPSGIVRDDPPRLNQYVDVPAHAGMLLLRAFLGAISAAIFAVGGQIQGAYVAVALGFCGPALLGRLGEIPQVASIVAGDTRVSARAVVDAEHGAVGPGGKSLLHEHSLAQESGTEVVGEH